MSTSHSTSKLSTRGKTLDAPRHGMTTDSELFYAIYSRNLTEKFSKSVSFFLDTGN